jgi:hypothetical protein
MLSLSLGAQIPDLKKACLWYHLALLEEASTASLKEAEAARVDPSISHEKYVELVEKFVGINMQIGDLMSPSTRRQKN